MRVLLVYKNSNLDIHGQRVREYVSEGNLPPETLTRLQSAHDQHYTTLEELKEALTRGGIAFDELNRGSPWANLHVYDAVVTVGGDGTLLSASHRLLDPIPIIGVRSSSASVGFLCAYHRDNLPELVRSITESRLATHDVVRLRARLLHCATQTQGTTIPVLNDFLFANRSPAATTRYRIRVKDRYEVQKSSGVWVSTPVGSTAAISAAGGLPMSLRDRRAQYRVRELFIPPDAEQFQLRGGILDEAEPLLSIENRCEVAILAMDGQHGEVALGYGDQITFHYGPILRLVAPHRMMT